MVYGEMVGYIMLTGTTKHETELAVLIDFGDRTEWIPKSCMEDWPDYGKTDEVIVKEYIAKDKGLL